MNVFLYQDKDTFFHRLDPRTKIFILLFSFFLTIFFKHPLFLTGVALFMLIHGYLSQCIANILRVKFPILLIALFSIITWGLSVKGTTPIWGRFSEESLRYGLAVALKLDSMIIAGIVFLSTTRNEEISSGVIRLGIPYKVSFSLSLALRMIPTLIETATTVIEAQRSRGLDLRSKNIFTRMKRSIPLLAPIFLTTIRTTNQLAMALEARGFGLSKERTSYQEIRFKGRDYGVFVILLIVALLIGFILLRG
jgi:energy-coupling factor transport system permease protein